MPARPTDTACPGAGWTQTTRTATDITNGSRPVFAYQGSPTPGTYSELTSVATADFPTAIALRSTLYLDPDPVNPPGETSLTTRVFLRNQNRPPVATFTATASARKITLNASESDDPEGNRLLYQWFDNGVAMTDPITGVAREPSPNAVYTFTAAAGTPLAHAQGDRRRPAQRDLRAEGQDLHLDRMHPHHMRSRLNSSDGYAIASAMILMTIMMMLGLAAMALVDTETKSSGRERTHETRLNLTEGVIAAEIFHLSRTWPAEASQAFPETCTAGTTDPKCPSPSQLKAQFSSVDVRSPEWQVTVRDDVLTSQYYDDPVVQARPRFDENRNGEMWVRAEATLKGKKRVVVARVRVEALPLSPPKAPFVAGKFNTGNNAGNKVIVETTPGVYGVVRCDNGTDVTSHSGDCIDYGNGQMSPTNMVKSDVNAGAAIPPGLMDSLKQMAINNGTYYGNVGNSCPDPSGAVVFIEQGNCKYQGNMVVNGASKKGIFIIRNGTLELAGSVTWWGVIYAMNEQNCGGGTGATNCLDYKGYSDNVVTITGTPTVHGAIFVDGDGRLGIGNSGNAGNCANCLPNLMYDPSVVADLVAYGTAGIIQNTWREIPPA